MNKRDVALKIAHYNESLDKFNWIARWREMIADRAKKVPMLQDRYAVYEHVNSLIGNKPITYLEFGVASGKSMRSWVKLNQHPDSRFVGFDTFEGLPEDWNKTFPKGAFTMHGKPPEIDDTRLHYEIGFFQKTLRPYLEAHRLNENLVIHLDADIYSATLFALTQLDAYMPPGTIIIFDEFQSFIHEFRAWSDYLSAYLREFDLLVLATRGINAAVRITG